MALKKIGYILNVAWQVIFVLNFALMQLLLYPLLWFLFAHESRWKAAMVVQRFWAGWLRVTMGVKTKIYYEAEPDKNARYIYAPNHTSFLDILVAYKYIPNYFHFLAKASLAKIPLFSIMFWKTHIPFERSNAQDSNQAYKRAGKDLDKGYSVLLYPEGTQNTHKNALLKFKSGAFRLAVEKQVPVVPVTCFNNLEILPHQKKLFKPGPGGPGTIYILIGKPIAPSEAGNDPEVLKEKVYTIVSGNLKQFYADRQGYCRALGRTGKA